MDPLRSPSRAWPWPVSAAALIATLAIASCGDDDTGPGPAPAPGRNAGERKCTQENGRVASCKKEFAISPGIWDILG